MKTCKRQRGAALVIALVIVAMAIVLATALVWHNHLDRRRVANQLYGAEALANALGVEDFVRVLLAEDEIRSDHLLEPWAQQGNVFPIEGGSLSGSVIDLQGRFNINNLVNWESGEHNEAQVDIYRRLLQSLGLDERLVEATLDWIDPDIEATGFGGAEDDTYLRSTPAYRAANRPLASVSELRLLANMTPEQFAVLQPYVSALPADAGITTVNINTAAPELLVALSEELTAQDAARLVELRAQAGFETLEDARAIIDSPLPESVFGVQSNYFRLGVLAVIGSSRVTMYSVLHRNSQTGVIRTISRSLGTP